MDIARLASIGKYIPINSVSDWLFLYSLQCSKLSNFGISANLTGEN